MNWYVYCHNDPVNFFDIMGLEESRDKLVLNEEDYKKIQMLTAIYIDAIENGDTFTADHSHAYAARIRSDEKYTGIDGYGPAYIDETNVIDNDMQILPIKGYNDTYSYSNEINVFAILISSPYTDFEAEIKSGRMLSDISDSQSLSAANNTTHERLFGTISDFIDVITLFGDDTLKEQLLEGDVKVAVNKIRSGIEYYFHENSDMFYYKKE